MFQRVVGYVRVSTDEQRHGPSAQKDALNAWCARTGAVLVAVHEDIGVSGAAALGDRPGMVAALADLGRGGVLLVAKRDRLARDPIVSALITSAAKRAGGRIVSCAGEGTDGDDPASVLMSRIVDAFAEYERLLISVRTRAALEAKRQRSELTGKPPIGACVAADGVHLEADPTEQAALARIRSLRGSGTSLRKIAATLNEEGVPCRGARWHTTTVARTLARAPTPLLEASGAPRRGKGTPTPPAPLTGAFPFDLLADVSRATGHDLQADGSCRACGCTLGDEWTTAEGVTSEDPPRCVPRACYDGRTEAA